jgi:hypothetical protein
LEKEKDYLNVEHNKLKRNYRNMEQILLKWHKELEELRTNIGNVYQAKTPL